MKTIKSVLEEELKKSVRMQKEYEAALAAFPRGVRSKNTSKAANILRDDADRVSQKNAAGKGIARSVLIRASRRGMASNRKDSTLNASS